MSTRLAYPRADEWLKNWSPNKGPRSRSDSEQLLARLGRYAREFMGIRLSALTEDHLQHLAGVVGAVGLVFILGLAWAITSYNPTVSAADRDAHAAKLRSNLPTEALINCEDFVRQRLKAPASSKVGHAGLSDEAAQVLPDSSYRVNGWVDAINSFGVRLRSNYTCVVRPAGNDRWQLVSLVIR